MKTIYQDILQAKQEHKKLLAILIDPERFLINEMSLFLEKIPEATTHFFVGGSTATFFQTDEVIIELKKHTPLPIILFPGSADQISENADALLFLSLLSGDNPEYLIGQHLKAVPKIKHTTLEVIPTAYILIDGGRESAVQRVSKTQPVLQTEVEKIKNLAIASFFLGKKIVYLETGSGALNRVNNQIIEEVTREVNLPLIVGGGIRSTKELKQVYQSGADMVVIGTAFEENNFVND